MLHPVYIIVNNRQESVFYRPIVWLVNWVIGLLVDRFFDQLAVGQTPQLGHSKKMYFKPAIECRYNTIK